MGFGDVYFSLRHTQIGRPEKHVSKNVKGPKFMASRRKRTINLLGCGGATFYSRWICKDTPQAMGVLVSANKAHFVWVCGFCRVRMISYSQRIQQKKKVQLGTNYHHWAVDGIRWLGVSCEFPIHWTVPDEIPLANQQRRAELPSASHVSLENGDGWKRTQCPSLTFPCRAYHGMSEVRLPTVFQVDLKSQHPIVSHFSNVLSSDEWREPWATSLSFPVMFPKRWTPQ